MSKGYLVVKTSTALGYINVKHAEVVVENKDLNYNITTQTSYTGISERIPLETKDAKESLDSTIDHPYIGYDVIVKKQGFEALHFHDVAIFENQISYIFAVLIPSDVAVQKKEFTGLAAYGKKYSMPVQGQFFATQTIRTPTIPSTIAVKLGVPGSNAEVVNVNFIDYIKNVASSEIYPTWPVESLKANIYAIISIALNRIYTEWYRHRGFDFDITNTTALDQKYIKDREIYENISILVDDLFNEYIHKKGFVEPFFAAFCDGKQVNCEGLKQWETLNLANQGKNALEILRTFYGPDIDIIETNQIENVTISYPGTPIKLGSTGNKVALMQMYLTRIAFDYPSIPFIFPLNGIFDRKDEEAVKQFQRIFMLPITGEIDKSTWYKIIFIYTSVKKLGELSSEGLKILADYLVFKHPLSEGDRSTQVFLLQYGLNVISEFIDTIPSVSMDTKYGSQTKEAVMKFQATFGLPETGIVDRKTWNKFIEIYKKVSIVIPPIDQLLTYPGTPLKEGNHNDAVMSMQHYLNTIAIQYPHITKVTPDGVFDARTKAQVLAFQKEFGLTPNGIVDANVWYKILQIYSDILSIALFPGTLLREGEQGHMIAAMQGYVNKIAEPYPSIPISAVDDYFGPKTKSAILAFQRLFGLEADGIVGKITWNKILEIYLSIVNKNSEVVQVGDMLQTAVNLMKLRG